MTGAKCEGVTRFRLCTPSSSTRANSSLSSRAFMARPRLWWLMDSFWQNTHPSAQPLKNTVPLPRVPLMHGSSHRCAAARATTGNVPMWQ